MEAAAVTEGDRLGTFAAFASRDFRLLWGGQTISFVGDAAFVIAVGWRVTALTKSPGALGLRARRGVGRDARHAALGRRPRRPLLAPAADDLVGSRPRGRRVVFFVVEVTGHVNLTAIIVLAACFGAADGFFQPAFGGIVTARRRDADAAVGELLDRDRATGQRGARAGDRRRPVRRRRPGDGVGDRGRARSSISAGALWLARPRRAQPEPQLGLRRELAVGFRYVISVPWIWTGIAAATVILMVAMAPYSALLPRIVPATTTAASASYALLFSLMAAGMVVGSLVWAKWHPRRNRVVVCFASFGVNDLGIVVLALSPGTGSRPSRSSGAASGSGSGSPPG